MRILTAFAIDDEPLALRVITSHVRQIPFLRLVGTTTQPLEGLLRVQQGGIDLVFLDIQMATLTGLQFLQLLQGKCAVILTTAYPHYALASYEYAVTDYLLKPIAFDRLLKAVQRVYQQASPPAIPTVPKAPHCLFVKTDHRLVNVRHADLWHIEGGKDYATVVTTQEKLLTLTSLHQLVDQLPYPQFLRVHKSYLVALDKIRIVERQRIYTDKAVIPIGDTYRATFMHLVAGR